MTPENKVLDHGFVKLLNIAGPIRRNRVEGAIYQFDADDRDPAIAARMSFNNMDMLRKPEDDHKLARYLLKNRHTSPFEMITVWLEMKLPIFVARQFVRHRTTSLNEVSGRYVTLPDEWYIPSIVGGKAKNVKQGQADNLTEERQALFRRTLTQHCSNGYVDYLDAIENGVAPEHARLFLSLNHYTHWIWKQDLHNLMHFLSLRVNSHAQIEAQEYAKAIIDLVRQQLPKTMELFDELRMQQ